MNEECIILNIRFCLPQCNQYLGCTSMGKRFASLGRRFTIFGFTEPNKMGKVWKKRKIALIHNYGKFFDAVKLKNKTILFLSSSDTVGKSVTEIIKILRDLDLLNYGFEEFL